MNTQHRVFTPLRMALMIAIAAANLLALFTIFSKQTPWSEALGVFAIVFIMLFVFVILLELVWMHHRAKSITDMAIRKKYRLAKTLYLIFFVMGFVISYFVLMT
jgi:protein-S-isoprenylcysteine O-methyltransferase Ste14